jgi:hypothetical protein
MSRRQAEATAVADIASVVEVQINDTVEDHDTSVERNGRFLSQNVRIQTTRRVVTGILSGVEIKEVFFDAGSLNWHALAVLDRARAGAGAAEAVTQRLARGRAVLGGLGRGPVSDLVALRRLDRMTTELDRLAVALAIFAPARKAEAKAQIEAFKTDVAARRDDIQPRATVRVVLAGRAGGTLPASLRQAAAKPLTQAGFSVVKGPAAGELRVDVKLKTATQVGAMRIYKVSASASFRLMEQERVLLEGEVPIDALSASRSSSEHLARTRSLDRLAERLRKGIDAMLNNGEE